MIKHGEANPLNVHGLRQVDHCPPHFTPVMFDLYVNEKDIIDWLYENLSGRFYIGQTDIEDNNTVVRKNKVAFEIPGEASYFSMMLPQINQNSLILI